MTMALSVAGESPVGEILDGEGEDDDPFIQANQRFIIAKGTMDACD